MAKHFACIVGVLLALGWAATGDAQPTQFSLELGYQWVDVSGNEGVFRTQVNEKPGSVAALVLADQLRQLDRVQGL